MPSISGDAEISRMFTEKVRAFTDSWFTMTSAVIRANQGLAASFLRPFTMTTLSDMQDVGMNVFRKGLAPYHRAATSNVVRLANYR